MKKSCMPRGRKKWKRRSRRKNSESPERRLPRFETQLGTPSRLLAGVRLAGGPGLGEERTDARSLDRTHHLPSWDCARTRWPVRSCGRCPGCPGLQGRNGNCDARWRAQTSGSVVVRLAKSALIFVTALQAALRANTGRSARHEGPPSGPNARRRAALEKETEGLTLVSTRHSAPQFPLRPYNRRLQPPRPSLVPRHALADGVSCLNPQPSPV